MQVLSILTGNRTYGEAALRAISELFARRSDKGLLGKHISITTGKWQETVSGVGSNSDSFYEYLLKISLLFNKREYFHMFNATYAAVKQHASAGDWFMDVVRASVTSAMRP